MSPPLIRKLEVFGPLPDRDKQALELATRHTRQVGAGRDLVREGDRPTECQLILQGFAYRHRTPDDGQRQIMGFEIPGDLCDLHGFLMGRADHAVATLTPCEVATLPRDVLMDWYEERPVVAHALWRGMLVDAAISRTWLLGIARRTARERVAHLLCEVLRRLQAVGLAEDGGGTLPFPPAEIADALGLSVVHVHRTLQSLHREGLVTPGVGQVTIDDPPGLQAACGFDPAYLYLKGDGDGQVRSQGSGRRLAGAANEALREVARERERMVAMLSHSQTLVCDWDGRVEVWTQGMERLFGYTPAEAMGTFARELLCSEFPEPWPAVVAALRGEGRWQGEVRHRHKDGSARFAHETWAVQPGLDDCAASLMAAVEDQTAVKRAEAALREANATLEARVEARTAELMAVEASLRQSQKMEAIGQLTGGLAHDFNNVLQGITGNLDLLRLRVEQGRVGTVARYLAAAQKSVQRAAALTHRLLAFARQLPLDATPVSLDALAVGMEELIRRTVGPSVQVELRLGDGLWLVRCDEGQLENALLSLAINARDAMPDGGWLMISTGEVHLSAADLAGEEGTAPGAFATVAVTDTGAGMTPEVMARAFEPFFTTKPLGQGTGLGLSQIYGFVRQSGGVVRLESTPGQGTTVRIFLPRHELADDAMEGDGTGDVVLLVEDEEELRQTAAEWLRELGYRVLEAPNGAAALRLLDGGSRVDVLVADMGLPGGLDGRQVADAARGRRPGLPVLFMTGYAETGTAEPEAETISKPFPLEVLAERIGAVLEAARPSRG